MADALNKALKEHSLSESAKNAISEAWETKLQEARDEIAAQLRDEFAQKYEKDRGEIVEALDVMIKEKITESVLSLSEAKKEAHEERVKWKKSVIEVSEQLDTFVKDVLTREIEEFRADRAAQKDKINELDANLKSVLEKELVEFHEDRRRLIDDRVAFKVNSAKELAEAKKKLVSKISAISEKFIKEHLTKEMTQLQEELIEARKTNFGNKIFEAFAAEFGSSFFNERKEIKKLLSIIEEQNGKLSEAGAEIAKREIVIAEGKNKLRIMEDRSARTKTMNELCSSLAGSKRKIMEELLEKVPTHKLHESFNSYLPSVISEDKSYLVESSTSGKKKLKEVTGDKNVVVETTATNSGVKDILTTFQKMEQYANNKSSVLK